MADPGATRLSAVVVTYNSSAAVGRTLSALQDQLQAGDELVVVDNASADDTVEVVRAAAPHALVVQLPHNVGFAAAANEGAALSSGELLLFLNPDATPAPGFCEAIRKPLRDGRRWAAWMGLVTAQGGRVVNTNGGVVHFTALAWAGEAGAPTPGSLDGPREVAFASGACLAARRDRWERVGGFASEYFMYHEDVDFSLRLRLAGERVGIEPSAVVDHDYEFAKGPEKWRLLERNRWATIVRCYPGPLIAAVAPVLLATELALIVLAASGHWLPQKRRAVVDSFRSLPRLLGERRAIQAARAVSVADFAACLTGDLDSPYLGRASRLAPLRAGLRLYWRAATTVIRTSERGPQGRNRRGGRTSSQ